MNALGEVGKKMRSAVKAKLLELGTGLQSGYIDDELPDYVMIMVANKRDKEQMKRDLQLFLGSHTETFVNWLHQVLQKLQEVTLPNNLTSKAKKKITETPKRDKKKDKKKKETSITDVIADELMEKAKKTLSDDSKLKDESATPSPRPAETEKTPEPSTPPSKTTANVPQAKEDDEFNIPTISEIKTAGNLHKKELSQLAELQSRIYLAKKKLKELDPEDEEILQKTTNSDKIPAKAPEITRPSSVISLSAIKKAEKEIYIAPSFRKLIEKQKEDNEKRGNGSRRDEKSDRSRTRNDRFRKSRSRSRSRSPSRDKLRTGGRRDRSRSPKSSKPRLSVHQRIGSRIVVNSPPIPPPPSIKREITKAKIKTRPALNSAITARAGKNLLLRAVAEAQKSTTSLTTRHEPKSMRDNIVVQVAGRKERDLRRIRVDEEYVPESVTLQKETTYRPSKNLISDDGDDEDVIYLNNVDEVDLDDLDRDEVKKSPQFVVTMEGVNRYDRESHSPTPPPVIKRRNIKDRIGVRPGTELERLQTRQPLKRKSIPVEVEEDEEEEHESVKAYNRVKRSKVSPIKFDLTDEEDNKSDDSPRKRNVSEKSADSIDDKANDEEQKRIKLESSRSFDHVPPLLSSVAIVAPEQPKPKTKERCKFYPSCSNTNCAFYHPTQPCKMFPGCKFGDTCAYIHPKCKFDLSCNRVDCNFSHTQLTGATNPIISSSIVPAQSFKSVTPTATICKFFPNCSNTNCTFLHPKLCKFGKSCLNKFECNFYHFEVSSKSKFKWISPLS